MEEIYKDWKIKYYEKGNNKFIATKEEDEIIGNSLEEIKAAIDKHIKKAFKRTPCFYREYDGIVEAEITSVFKTGSDGNVKGVYIHIINDTTRKINDYRLKDIYKYSEKNKQLIKEIQELNEKAKKLDKEISSKKQEIEKIEFEKQY